MVNLRLYLIIRQMKQKIYQADAFTYRIFRGNLYLLKQERIFLPAVLISED
jgi:hypothetical protein